jgi:DNA-binding transcriptional LysR family regulator
MPCRLPPAQALHAFDAAARHMSLTEAARELGVTQAAISQRIRLLEQRLGQPLFLRHPRGLELTDAGRALLPAVHDAFERLSAGIASAMLCDTLVVTVELAANNAGIALGRSGFIEPLIAAGRLAVPFDLWLDTHEAFYLARVAGRDPKHKRSGPGWRPRSRKLCRSE